MQLSKRELLKFSEVGTGNPMRCHRCESIMVYEKFYGPHEHFWAWRCIYCGEIVDQIILENRVTVAIGTLRV